MIGWVRWLSFCSEFVCICVRVRFEFALTFLSICSSAQPFPSVMSPGSVVELAVRVEASQEGKYEGSLTLNTSTTVRCTDIFLYCCLLGVACVKNCMHYIFLLFTACGLQCTLLIWPPPSNSLSIFPFITLCADFPWHFCPKTFRSHAFCPRNMCLALLG